MTKHILSTFPEAGYRIFILYNSLSQNLSCDQGCYTCRQCTTRNKTRGCGEISLFNHLGFASVSLVPQPLVVQCLQRQGSRGMHLMSCLLVSKAEAVNKLQVHKYITWKLCWYQFQKSLNYSETTRTAMKACYESLNMPEMNSCQGFSFNSYRLFL